MIDDAVKIAAALCRRFEGFSAEPYLCPAGVPTIGYGSTYYENGATVTPSDKPITRDRAEAMLMHMLCTDFAPKVIKICPNMDSPGRLAALIDFAYNLGAGRLATSTLRKRVNSGEWGKVPGELMRWNKAGGRVLAGLTARRAAESALI